MLEQNHVNYNALYSLALSAAINRLPLTIRARDTPGITPDETAIVQYLHIDWPGVSPSAAARVNEDVEEIDDSGAGGRFRLIRIDAES